MFLEGRSYCIVCGVWGKSELAGEDLSTGWRLLRGHGRFVRAVPSVNMLPFLKWVQLHINELNTNGGPLDL